MRTKTLTPLVAALSLAMGSTAAFAIDEMEPNDSASAAQAVSAPWGSIKINAMMGSDGQAVHTDLDFYQFEGKSGDVLSLDIDNGYSETQPLDTIIAVFGPAPDYKLLRTANRSDGIDEGSISEYDPRIDDFVVPGNGTYTIGVSSGARTLISGGQVLTSSFFGPTVETVASDYTLEVSGASVVDEVKMINIEVKPGSDAIAPINPRSKGKIPVAILGSSSFSVMTVDTDTVTFGATGSEPSLHKCAKSIEDVNGDGHYDLVCHFNNQSAGFNYDTLEGVLMGETKSGEKIEGSAWLKTVPGK